MGCDFPIPAYRMAELHPSGKNMITFNPVKAMNSTSHFGIPCGRCTGCRLDKARQWATRCHHEARLYEDNSFLTLTYSDENLPEDGSIHLRELQLFFKKLRRRVEPNIRFYACGEYGDRTGRPHYHALVFNYFPDDRKIYTYNKHKQPLWTSKFLDDVWGLGHVYVGSVTHQSAGYVARYTMKKVNGDLAKDHYLRPHPITGKLYQVKPEFSTMSKKPGIGHGYVERFKSDFFPSDFCVVNGVKTPVPRYYFNQLSEEEKREIKLARSARAVPYKAERTNARRFAKMTVRDARISPLKRDDL